MKLSNIKYMPAKRDIIYPIFLECCNYTDNYWSQIFEDLAYCKCPYGSYINKNFLCCNFRGKEFTYSIDTEKDPQIIYQEVYNLLYNKLGLTSNKQRLDKLKTIEDADSDWKYKKWNTIKKKNVRDILIDNYIIEMKKTHNLDNGNTLRLKNIILSGLLFKTINSKDIDYSDGIVNKITGINFAQNQLLIDPSITEFSPTPGGEKNTNRIRRKKLADLWITRAATGGGDDSDAE